MSGDERVKATDPNPWRHRPQFNWAHQGGACEGPSNTLHAMRTALAHGASGLELDVHRTADGVLVVCHDPSLDRTTSGHGRISERSLEYVQSVDSAYWWVDGQVDEHDDRTPVDRYVYRCLGPANHDFRVPTLGEVMRAFPTAPLNLELKEKGYEAQLARELSEDGREDVIVVSFSERRLKKFRAAAPTMTTAVGIGFLVTFWLLSRIGIARRPPQGVVALEVPHRWARKTICDRRLLAAAHKRDLALYVWTIADEAEMKELLELGVDGIMTDYPARLARLTGMAPSGVYAPQPRPSSLPSPPTTVVNEVRIHGVGGSPGPKLLGFDDPVDAPVDVAHSRDHITIRSRPDPPFGMVEGFDWGDLTSGARVQALWVFLLPFTLLNVAGWAYTSVDTWLGTFWRGATRVLMVVAGWLLTAIWMFWLADLLVGYCAYQWAPQAIGTRTHVVPLWHLAIHEQEMRYSMIGVSAAVLAGVIVAVGIVAGRSRQAVSEPRVGAEAVPFAENDGPIGRTHPGKDNGDGPIDRDFFAKRPSIFASLPAHVIVAVAATAIAVVHACLAIAKRGDRPAVAPIDRTMVVVTGANSVLIVLLALCSWWLPWAFSHRTARARSTRHPNGTATAAVVLATAVTNAFFSGVVLLVVKYLGKHPKGVGTLTTGRDLAPLDTYLAVAGAWAVIGGGMWLFRRSFTRMGRLSTGRDAVRADWTKRTEKARASAAVAHKADLLLVALAAAFVFVEAGFALRRIDVLPGNRLWQFWRWAVDAPDAKGAAYSAVAWGLPIAVGFVLVRVRKAATDNRLSRFIGQAWDVLSFWPRRHHPFAVRAYSHTAVPALQAQLTRLTSDGASLVISAHSQGTVLAVSALATIDDKTRSRIALVTYGSHVPGLYRRAFPEYFNPTLVAEVGAGLGGTPNPQWDNFYRLTDPIGTPMFGEGPLWSHGIDHCLPDPATDAARPFAEDPAPPREHDREAFTALAVHSYYLNEQELKKRVEQLKVELDRAAAGHGARAEHRPAM